MSTSLSPTSDERTILGGMMVNGVAFIDSRTGLAKRPELPGGSSRLWRYMDFPKLVSLLDRRALFFTRADKLGDEFEGSFSKPCKDRIEEWAEETGARAMAFDRVVKAVREDRKRSVVSCWHEQDHESEAMWKLYGADRHGIAVRTDFASLLASLDLRAGEHHTNMRIGRVSYVDYETDDMHLFNGMLLFHKRKSFDHEREVRLARWLEWKRNGVGAYHIFDGEVIDGAGIYWPVNLDELIHEIVVSPLAEDWFEETVSSMVAKLYSPSLTVRKSSLADPPGWEK